MEGTIGMSIIDDRAGRGEVSPDDEGGQGRGSCTRAFVKCVLLIAFMSALVIIEISSTAGATQFVGEAVRWLRRTFEGPARPYAVLISIGVSVVGALLISSHIHFGERAWVPKHWLLGGGVLALLTAGMIAVFSRLPLPGGSSAPLVHAEVPQESSGNGSREASGGSDLPAPKPEPGGGSHHQEVSGTPGTEGSAGRPHAVMASYSPGSTRSAVYYEPRQEGSPAEEPEVEEPEEPEGEEQSSGVTSESSSSVSSSASTSATSSATATSSSSASSETSESLETGEGEEETECE